MKRIIPITIGLGILAAFAWTLIFLYQKSQAKAVVYETETPFVTDIVKKSVATGKIVPREEIEIKPRINGVIDKLEVEPGDKVKKGDVIARIKVIPDMVNLNAAESRVSQARIRLRAAKRELDRARQLLAKQALSEANFRTYELDYQLRKQEVSAAWNNLQLIKKGATSGASGKVSNVVYSTVNGTILTTPFEEGASVIQSNNFNPGTTIATIANMSDMIFQGWVDESEVGKIKEGMQLDIRVGALEKVVFKGKLEYIAPKGVDREGTIQFEIKAAIKGREDVYIRAGYSANADIVLDKRDKVLAVREAAIDFKKGKAFVEVEVAEQEFERREIKVGLSDGINIEVTSGLDENTKLKKR
jgi:HlyD family secretion protein